MRRAIITLTSDFGLRDSYVAQMKAVILGIAADAVLVDLTHDVGPHDVTEGALALEAAVPFFPRGTIHLGIVDPGVGTARRGIALVSRDDVFVGPDNGLFTPFIAGSDWSAFELSTEEFRRPVVSQTFHGRDVFAPAAAHVARGVAPSRLGPPVTDPVRLRWPEAREVQGAIAGVVVHVDRFGNLVTSIRADAVRSLRGDVAVRIRGRLLSLVGTYGDLKTGAAGALVGSSDRLEIAVREGSAADRLRARRGTPVVVTRTPASTRERPPRSSRLR